MELSQGNKSLIDLAKGAYKGEIMLPDFQRNFVWARQDIEELIKSLLEKMFIGNFLIHNINPLDPPFKPIPIEGSKQLNPNYQEKPSILILDGQQRLSSLFYALYSPDFPLRYTSNPYAFFISIQALLDDEIENSVGSRSKAHREFKNLFLDNGEYDFKKLIEQKLIPMTFLSKDFSDIWYENYQDHFEKEESKKVRSYVKNVLEYKALTLDVPVNEKAENIAVLFERINRTGIKLSIFDLLVARLYKFLNLRSVWEQAFDESENIKRYVLHNKRETQVPYYFIQALVLANGKSIKSRDMLGVDDRIINQSNWDKLINQIESNVLQRLLDINEYGIARVDKWLPYSPMLVPYSAFFLKGDCNITKINKWYWASVFSERYASSVESKISKDYREVQSWFSHDERIPEVIADFRNSLDKTFKLADKVNAGNSVYKGVFNLLFINDAKDFYEDDKIKFSRKDLDDHHIFPKAFLDSKGIKDNVNSILNRTLIHNTTNRSISKKSPSSYIQVMNEKLGGEILTKDLLKKHFISSDMYSIMMEVTVATLPEVVEEKFNQFLSMREKLIKEAIQAKI